MTVWRGIFRPRSARSGGSLLNNLGFYINGFFLRILPLGEKQRHHLDLIFRLNSLNTIHFLIYFSSITKASSPTPKSTVDGSSSGNFRRGRRSTFLL